MQVVADGYISSRDDDADLDSLFGSPPPSLGRGRSPSPTPLALPGGVGSVQNVGTLALPGLHPVAELPVVPPPALLPSGPRSASQPSRSIGHQPPYLVTPGASTSGSSPRPRAASCTPRTSQIQRRPRRATEKSSSATQSGLSTPRPTPPPIPLPSPDEPLPPNFLRSQQALLGLAGLVGGVNPAQLSVKRPERGSSVQNPIVLDDVEEERLQRSRAYTEPPSLSKRPYLNPVNPSQLPRPTGEDVLATLVRQKNVFPVLESLLRLLNPQNAPASYYRKTGFEKDKTVSRSAPPPKRRKLNSVPAGAADWDVPFPFEAGQGPADYHESWERARAKQLLADLVVLVKDAAKKAALKSYLDQYRVKKVWGHYRPETLMYGLDPSQRSTALQGQTSGGSTPQLMNTTVTAQGQAVHDASQAPWEEATSEGNTPFDQLVASLMAATQQSGSTTPGPSQIADADAENTPPDIESWLSMITSYTDVDIHGSSAAAGQQPQPSDVVHTQSLPSSDPSPKTSSSVPDFVIDPALLALSADIESFASELVISSHDQAAGHPPTPMLSNITSPLASTGSLPDVSPATPEWSWVFGDPEIAEGAPSFPELDALMNVVGNVGFEQQGLDLDVDKAALDPMPVQVEVAPLSEEPLPGAMVAQALDLNAATLPTTPPETQTHQQTSHPSLSPPSITHDPSAANTTSLSQQLDSSLPVSAPPPATAPSAGPWRIPPQATHFQLPAVYTQRFPTSAYYQPHTPLPAPLVLNKTTVDPKAARAAILSRARSLRSALVAEAQRAKIELWETTLEQGVLSALSKGERKT